MLSERQQLIRDMILYRHNLKISELSQTLEVSEMTIHRDIKPLIEEGLIMKTYGGLTLIRDQSIHRVEEDECVYCHRKCDDRLVYRIILLNGERENACCSHCGILRHRQLGDEVAQAICTDFLTGTTISAHLAWFVLDTTVHIRCCYPQVLVFETKEYAENFVKGFGGKVLTFSEIMKSFPQHLKLSCKNS
ncbi:DeoR family transcriptional regulator [Lysinibacillus sp. K60]|uniref:DeoR family transcriptional regulator n=1 Tax=Lysinibacillus sp. K60 TaxID=2720027 RepID=UPI001C8B5ADD|nr:DeoR family transcriptional regulator [Lysinibacillus sp. K60]MBX8947054.1 DeoR family transcriptional regulator [Lysinibacillus sp. K60]